MGDLLDDVLKLAHFFGQPLLLRLRILLTLEPIFDVALKALDDPLRALYAILGLGQPIVLHLSLAEVPLDVDRAAPELG